MMSSPCRNARQSMRGSNVTTQVTVLSFISYVIIILTVLMDLMRGDSALLCVRIHVGKNSLRGQVGEHGGPAFNPGRFFLIFGIWGALSFWRQLRKWVVTSHQWSVVTLPELLLLLFFFLGWEKFYWCCDIHSNYEETLRFTANIKLWFSQINNSGFRTS